MKLPTAKPSDQVMKFFAPDLILRFNSDDDGVADLADREWETAVQGYRDHLKNLSEELPDQVKSLARLNLHDAEFLTTEQPAEPLIPVASEPMQSWSGLAILDVKEGDEIVSLIYVLWDRIRRHEAVDGWPFSTTRTHWLYDEVDTLAGHQGQFWHRVLLSDGVVVEIPFVAVVIHRIPLQVDRQIDPSRQSA